MFIGTNEHGNTEFFHLADRFESLSLVDVVCVKKNISNEREEEKNNLTKRTSS